MSELSDEAATALRGALGAEHAAIWAYGLASAFAREGRVSSAMNEAMNHHRAHRDAAERALRDAKVTPPAPRPAYAVPHPVTDQDSAVRLLVTTEQDCATGWRAALESTNQATVRDWALDGLTTAAVRATRWRITIDDQRGALAFPGQP